MEEKKEYVQSISAFLSVENLLEENRRLKDAFLLCSSKLQREIDQKKAIQRKYDKLKETTKPDPLMLELETPKSTFYQRKNSQATSQNEPAQKLSILMQVLTKDDTPQLSTATSPDKPLKQNKSHVSIREVANRSMEVLSPKHYYLEKKSLNKENDKHKIDNRKSQPLFHKMSPLKYRLKEEKLPTTNAPQKEKSKLRRLTTVRTKQNLRA